MKKVFLKLDGIKGASQAARHAGAIEVSSFYWGDGRTAALSIGKRRPLAAKDGLTIIKRTDNTTPDFLVAALTGQRFEGILTLEDYTASEKLVRSIVFELETVFVRSVTEIKSGEVINLRYKTIRLLRSGNGNAGGQRNGEKRFGVNITIMNKNLVILSIFLLVLAFCLTTVAKAQFEIKQPEVKIKKPDTKIRDGQVTTGGGQINGDNFRVQNNRGFATLLNGTETRIA